MAEVALPALRIDEVSLSVEPAPLVLINRDPAPQSDGIARTSAIRLDVLSLNDEQVDGGTLRIWVGGELAVEGGLDFPIHEEFAGRRSDIERIPGGLRIVLDPIVEFESQATIEVRVFAQAFSTAIDQRYLFTVEDLTGPRLVAAEAVSTHRVALSFDERVSISNLAATIEALEGPAVPLEVLAVEEDERGAAIVTLQTAMTSRVQYRITVTEVSDLSGNLILAPDNIAMFRGYEPPRPRNRRFDLWSMLPRHNRREDETRDLARLIACLQEVTDLLLYEIDRVTDEIDIERAAEASVDLWLRDLGNPFELVLDELEKRRLAAVLVEMYRLKGTEQGIRNAVRFFLGIELEVSPYAASSLSLGESLLGVDWEIGSSSQFALYSFEVTVPIALQDDERQKLRTLIEWMKPGHTHLIEIREPVIPIVVERWELGMGELGLTTQLG